MANPPPYALPAIPPPPLPEFRQRKTTVSAGSRHSSTSRDCSRTLDGVDERWQYHQATSHTKAVEPQRLNDTVSSLAIYHVCRICLRPRSARYHLEHPIPDDGVPPPPGICRRCRVVSVEDTKTIAQVVEQSESKDVKLGVKCLVPDADYMTNEQMRSRSASRIANHIDCAERERSASPRSRHILEHRPRRTDNVVYRHVHVTVPPPPPPFPPSPPSRPKLPSVDVLSEFKKQGTEEVLSTSLFRPRGSSRTVPASARSSLVPPPSSPPFAAAAALRKKTAADTSGSGRTPTTCRTRQTSGYRASVAGEVRPGPAETEIRRLARDEVVRYRQAERMIEAHREPFAHGRLIPVEQQLVPVERRIEIQADVAEAMPWHTAAHDCRRDSAVAVPISQPSRPNSRREGSSATYRSRQTPPAESPSVASSSSSGKTLWLAADRLTKHDLPPYREFAHSFRRQDSANGGNALHGQLLESAARDCEPVKIAQQSQQSQQSDQRRPCEETPFFKVTHRSSNRTDDELLAKATHRELAHDVATDAMNPRKFDSSVRANCEFGELEGSAQGVAEELPQGEGAFVVTKQGDKVKGQKVWYFRIPNESNDSPKEVMTLERVRRSDKQPSSLPYPRDGYTATVPMPSPSSHASQAPRSAARQDLDREYFYMERTVEPIDTGREMTAQIEPPGYYRESEEFLQRRRPAQRQSDRPRLAPDRRGAKQRRPSDVSSRVRFSNKLEISPTPPGSDASSSHFRNIGGRKQKRTNGQGMESGEGLTAEYEHRGRQRSRTPSRACGFYYERDVFRSLERGCRSGDGRNGDRISRSQYAPSETATGLSTLPSNIRPIARALSESPSREKLRAAALKQKSDGLPPYAEPQGPAASVVVEDGSTVTSESSGSYRRKVEVYQEHSGRRLKR